jgi:hypothetical protein
MQLSKRKQQGRECRIQALRRCFPDLDDMLEARQAEHLPLEDVLDAQSRVGRRVALRRRKGAV